MLRTARPHAMLRTAVRNLLVHRLRFALPALAVLLGVAFVSGSLMYTESVRDGQALVQRESRPDVSVAVRAAEPGGAGLGSGGGGTDADADEPVRLDGQLLERLRALPGVSGARGTVEGRALLVGRDGELVGDAYRSTGVNWVPDAHGDDPRYPLHAGRGPRTSGEVALDEQAAHDAGYAVGDRVRVVVGGTARDARLTGTFTTRDSGPALGGTVTAFSASTAARHFSAPGRYTQITLTAGQGVSQAQLAQRAGKLLPRGAEAVTRTALDAEAVPEDPKLTYILLSFAAVALGVSVFLVANTFAMLSAARRRQHALLRTVGATRRQVLRLVLAEAGLVGVLASAAGYGLGIGVAEALNGLFGAVEGPGAPVRMFAAAPLLAAFGVGTGVTMVAAWVPARRAASVPPVAALGTGVPPAARTRRLRDITGSAVTAAGALLLYDAASGDENLLYAAVPVLLTGLIVLTPLLASGFARLLRPPLVRVAGIRGRLAVENARRNPRRTAATATALMIGLSLVTAVTVGAFSLQEKVEQEAREGMAADLRITPVDFADVGADTAERIAKLPDAEAVTALVPVTLGLPGGDTLGATAVDARAAARLHQVRVRQGSLARLGHGIAVTSATAAEHGWHVGSRARVTTDGGVPGADGQHDGGGRRTRTMPVVAVYDGPEALSPALVSDRLLGGERGDASAQQRPYVASVLAQAAHGRIGALREAIRTTLDNPALLVHDRAAAEAEAVRPVKPLLNLLYALLSVTVLIGVLGVVNTLGMAVAERVREIGLLRAVGLDRKGVRSVFRLEAVLIALLGSALGLASGCVIGAAAVAAQGSEVLFPWARLAVFLAASTATGVLASVLPARRAAAVPTIEALTSDTE
ncbi:putative ABC transport system permease protein [Streptomyces sp. Amel2xB2]|uniref:FtsX-like permease family protein n=1 Tax=Streptomyces sp. Amel2xB2 TaxID=1305829 RepID=UPI000DC02A4F|nr:ABC transporter permease [Streptomyces sp. Amel2xB2]RAJ70022.1 putative ABC transport system permease protein [Streptomyces sp. Amel2xB2]